MNALRVYCTRIVSTTSRRTFCSTSSSVRSKYLATFATTTAINSRTCSGAVPAKWRRPSIPAATGGSRERSTRSMSTTALPDDVMYLPMPKLSPSMKGGKVTKWLKAEGDEINEYDAVMELSTDTLYAPGDAPVEGAPVEMVVELAEAGFVGKLLAAEGDFVEVGQPVMAMCEEEESVEALRKGPNGPEVDLYSDDGVGLRIAMLQGYLNGKTPEED